MKNWKFILGLLLTLVPLSFCQTGLEILTFHIYSECPDYGGYYPFYQQQCVTNAGNYKGADGIIKYFNSSQAVSGSNHQAVLLLYADTQCRSAFDAIVFDDVCTSSMEFYLNYVGYFTSASGNGE